MKKREQKTPREPEEFRRQMQGWHHLLALDMFESRGAEPEKLPPVEEDAAAFLQGKTMKMLGTVLWSFGKRIPVYQHCEGPPLRPHARPTPEACRALFADDYVPVPGGIVGLIHMGPSTEDVPVNVWALSSMVELRPVGESELLGRVCSIIRHYHRSLKERKHGGTAQGLAINDIEMLLNMQTTGENTDPAAEPVTDRFDRTDSLWTSTSCAATHDDKIKWMAVWAAKNGVKLELRGECGFGRECVGVSSDNSYLDYEWYDQVTSKRIDENGEVWTPSGAYRKHPCVAVLGRGEEAEEQLYQWLRYFDDNHFVVEKGNQPVDPQLGQMAYMMSKHRYARLVRSAGVIAEETDK